MALGLGGFPRGGGGGAGFGGKTETLNPGGGVGSSYRRSGHRLWWVSLIPLLEALRWM